jgi:hypothetical protein
LKNSIDVTGGAMEALTRLLVKKGIFTREEFSEMGRVMDREKKRKDKS